MSIEDIIRAWKNEEGDFDPHLPANPVGQELSEEELLAITGGDCTITCTNTINCDATCDVTCSPVTPALQ